MMPSSLTCPKCEATFRPGFTRCSTCHVDLISEADALRLKEEKRPAREALRDRPTVVVVQAGLEACKEIRAALEEGGVPAVLDAVAEEGEPLAAGALKVGVRIAEADLGRAGEVLRGRFEALVAKEGIGALTTQAIDLSHSEVACPACGHHGALAQGACTDCGLFLGAPE